MSQQLYHSNQTGCYVHQNTDFMFLNDKYNNDIENKKRGSCFVQLEDKALFGTALAAFGSITCAGHAPGGTIAGTVTSLDVDLNFFGVHSQQGLPSVIPLRVQQGTLSDDDLKVRVNSFLGSQEQHSLPSHKSCNLQQLDPLPAPRRASILQQGAHSQHQAPSAATWSLQHDSPEQQLDMEWTNNLLKFKSVWIRSIEADL